MKVLSFGEIIWDKIDEEEKIGGAPLNLLAHLARMGFCSSFISAVGYDELGKQALRESHSLRIDTEWIRIDPNLPTGTAVVTGNKNPEFDIAQDVAWDNLALSDNDLYAIEKMKWDVFCFGTLAQRSQNNRVLLERLSKKLSTSCNFLDVNLRQNFYTKEILESSLLLSTIVKMNHEEAMVTPRLLFGSESNVKEISAKIANLYKVTIIIITNGIHGSQVYHSGIFEEVSAKKVDVVDSVGSGDAYGAGFLFLYLQGYDIKEAAEFGAELGAFVASKKGATPDYTSELKQKIIGLHKDPMVAKHI